jgi:hypothetical protein
VLIRGALIYVLVGLSIFTQGCAVRATPRITLSLEKILDRGSTEMHGTGFSPKSIVKSHLRRPDNTEFPVLSFLTDGKGEFTHVIHSLELQAGTHEVWVIDSTGVSSNVVKFEVNE